MLYHHRKPPKDPSSASLAPMDHHVRLLRRQYLQLVEPSAFSFPTSPSILHSPGFQSALYIALFAPAAVPNPPPERYTTRVLKRLIALLSSVPESASGIEQEVPVISPSPSKTPKVSATDNITLCKKQEIHESLLELYTELLSRPSSFSALDIGAAGGYVTYVLPLSPYSGREIGQPVTLQESRNIISGQGTTGLRTWEAALALSEYLICTHLEWIYKNTPFAAAVEGCGRILQQTDSVLELGAGTGLVSVVAARLGASNVLATDGSSNVCETLLGNVKLNGVNDVVTVRQRLWGGEVEADERFDLVLGADVVLSPSTKDTPRCII